MKIRFIVAAQYELDEAYDWYEAQAKGLGGQLVEEMRLAVRRVAVFLESCQEIAPGIRRCLIRRFPYALIYRTAEEELVILAVMHQHRKPRDWQLRLKMTK
jgi:plasmid stabilization system protein ParE